MTNNTLIQNLQNKELYPHNILYFKVIETHISWVILTGEFVYKIKKPLDLGFLDFSTLEKRHYYCQKEVELNKKFAPDIYLEVIPIKGSLENPSFQHSGPIIEYAVKMQEFPQSCLFDHLLAENQLPISFMDKAAQTMAAFHLDAKKGLENNPYGTAIQAHEPVTQNFEQTRPLVKTSEELLELDELEDWANHQHEVLFDFFAQRKSQGFIRECHGDAHLGNIALINGAPVFFDCIEFNESIHWTDTMADVGFLCMDLEDHGYANYSSRFANKYFQYSGDYLGLKVLDYYKAYRAMVRAKVALFQALQSDSIDAIKELERHSQHCRHLAYTYIQPKKPQLIIMHGVTASGKSYVADMLAEEMGFIQISSDVERKRSVGLSPTADAREDVNQGLYAPSVTDEIYQQLANLTQTIIEANYSVVVDASFIDMQHRSQFAKLAKRLQVPFLIIATIAKKDVLQKRLIKRLQQDDRVSDAYLDVLNMQLAAVEPLSAHEKLHAILIDTEKEGVAQAVLSGVW